MLSYGEVIEIGIKGERLHFWRIAYPVIVEGDLALRADGRHIPVAELEAMAAVKPILEEIQARNAKSVETLGEPSEKTQ